MALITFFLYKKSIVSPSIISSFVILWPILLSSFVLNCFSRVHNILDILYWPIFPWEKEERKNQREEYYKASCTLYQVDLDHTSLSTSAPFTFLFFPFYTLYIHTMASSTQSLLNLDPEHISCIGGRTVVTCKGCAGNAPRYIYTSPQDNPYISQY